MAPTFFGSRSRTRTAERYACASCVPRSDVTKLIDNRASGSRNRSIINSSHQSEHCPCVVSYCLLCACVSKPHQEFRIRGLRKNGVLLSVDNRKSNMMIIAHRADDAPGEKNPHTQCADAMSEGNPRKSVIGC